MRYEDYLLTTEWKEKAQKRIEIDEGKCQMCGTTENIHVHHLTYHDIFHENPYTDLVCLCEKHHKAVHRMMNRINNEFGRRGWRDTLSYAEVTLKESEV